MADLVVVEEEVFDFARKEVADGCPANVHERQEYKTDDMGPEWLLKC